MAGASYADGSSDRGVRPASTFLILLPRESIAESAVVSDFRETVRRAEREKWRNIFRLFVYCLSFCICVPNIWRFPLKAILHGNATFIYIYMFYCLTLGPSLLFFEVSVGQTTNKGFAKLFSVCPLLEGLPYSMMFHCIIVNLLYNTVTIYSLCYLISPKKLNEAHNHNMTFHEFQKSDFKGEEHESEHGHSSTHKCCETGYLNLRNALLLLAIWIMIFLYLIFGVSRQLWITVVVSITIICTLTYTVIVASTLKGASQGLHYMFVPHKNDLLKIKTWVQPFEQFIVTLSLGMGPLIICGSYAKFRAYTHLNCVLINGITLICSMLSAMIMFMALGVLAHDINKPIETVVSIFKDREGVIFLHRIFIHMTSFLAPGLSHFTYMLFFLVLFVAGLYSTIIYTYTIIMMVKSYVVLIKRTRIMWYMIVCFSCFVLGIVMITEIGHCMKKPIDRVFMGTSALIIVCFEMVAFSYGYGLKNLCDEVEFMTGYVPNLYFQTTWLGLPVVFFILSFISFYTTMKYDLHTAYDKTMFGVLVVLIIVPVVFFFFYNCYRVARKKKGSTPMTEWIELFKNQERELDIQSVDFASHAIT